MSFLIKIVIQKTETVKSTLLTWVTPGRTFPVPF